MDEAAETGKKASGNTTTRELRDTLGTRDSSERTTDRLRAIKNVTKISAFALRELASLLNATQARSAQYDLATARATPWDVLSTEEIRSALERRAPKRQPDTLCLALARNERLLHLLLLRREGIPFTADEVLRARRFLGRVEAEYKQRERERQQRIVERTYAQLMRRLQGHDLHYRVLHALRALVHYDHSAAFLVHDEETGNLQLQAEQIAWRKDKSRLIGASLCEAKASGVLTLPENLPILIRDGEIISQLDARERERIALPRTLLDYHKQGEERPQVRSAILAPLNFEGHCLGLLAAYGLHPGSLSRGHCEQIRPLLPMAALAVANQAHDQSLERAFLEEQKKHAIAEMARGVAHDINNSLMVLVPRVQMLREDLEREGTARERTLGDLEVIERHAQQAQRIFRGMLSYAKRGAAPRGQVHLHECAHNVLEIQRSGIESKGIRLETDVQVTCPVRGNPGQLERVLHNLILNARQACEPGGVLRVVIRERGDRVRVLVLNSGPHVSRAVRARAFEPFFTTRRDSQGLGLALSRSIVVEHGGSLKMRSRPSCGTSLVFTLPCLPP